MSTLQSSPLLLATVATIDARNNKLYTLPTDFDFDTTDAHHKTTAPCKMRALH